MTTQRLLAQLRETPVIAAVKDEAGLAGALESDLQVVMVLAGDLMSIGGTVARIKEAGKTAFVHVDLIAGLSAKEVAVDFIGENTLADGIISTKVALVRHAKSRGMLTVQRFFLLDSIALSNIQKQMEQGSADLVEVLPGVMPKVIRKIVATARKPIVAGGLIGDEEDVRSALDAGAIAVSTTNRAVWFL